MNRRDRLARELKGTGLEDRADELAGLPVATVNLIIAGFRGNRRVGRENDRQVRRQRRADASKHRWYDQAELADRNKRIIAKAGDRATRDLDALESLAVIRDLIDNCISDAVPRLREQGISDPQIAAALHRTRDAVGRRFGRRMSSDLDTGRAS